MLGKVLRMAALSILLGYLGTGIAAPKDKYPKGLNPQAKQEIIDSGMSKYTGKFAPAASLDIGGGWTRHSFDPAGGAGPICIAGTPYEVFSKAKNPAKLLIMLQGGGACWQDFYFCNILAQDQAPPMPALGIWGKGYDNGESLLPNPLENWSVVYLPYCDGSVFSGDKDVADSNFPFAPVRFHRGLRNLTAGIDLAKSLFPNAGRIMVAGSSAGGVGASTFAAFLARMAFGNHKKLTVFNDAGTVVTNPAQVDAIAARANDWGFGQFFPASCYDCDAQGQVTSLIRWRLENDTSIREAFYSTDGDLNNRLFMELPTQMDYRTLLLNGHDPLNAAYPDRYKRFIRSGASSHTALQSSLLYLGTADGMPLYQWLADFPVPRPFWQDMVEDFVSLP